MGLQVGEEWRAENCYQMGWHIVFIKKGYRIRCAARLGRSHQSLTETGICIAGRFSKLKLHTRHKPWKHTNMHNTVT